VLIVSKWTVKMSLDAIGISQGTDKSSAFQGYLPHYERVFQEFRDLPINVVEIGILGGSSLRMWKRYFSLATIVGVDIMESCQRYAEDRIIIEIGSQDDPEFLGRLCDRYPPTIVIDDGSHQAKHMLATLQHVFPRLLPGGWYVIEDLHFCGGRDEVPVTPFDHICVLAKSLMTAGKGVAPNQPVEGWTRAIDRLDIIHGAAFLRKADPAGKLEALSVTESLVSQSGHPDNWYFLSDSLLRHGAPFNRVEHALRQAVAGRPSDSRYHWRLSEVLERKGDLAGAAATAARAVECRQREAAERGWSDEISQLGLWTTRLARLTSRQELK
jgi:hypothetical protein